MAESVTSQYTKTYTTFSGCDIVATFGDTVIGELQAITYSVSREKAPVYTMGSPEPRSFSRGKRGIAGTLVFTVFDRDALIEAIKSNVTRIGSNPNDPATNTAYTPMTIDEWDKVMSGKIQDTTAEERTRRITQENVAPLYADELPPFDVTISFANEYGQKAVLVIYGLEILNEGTGFSIDSVTTEKACTFVARKVDYMRPVDADGSIVTS
ncbi:hypothetical protein MKY88_24520 [Lysinibacillus sp. FSL R7-0073]|uniref:Phage tail protein n=1 Tax=Lysinibacillus fusiformis TaxID=28031 RepID=A0A1E4QYG9_9BACI|nr:hypothetical protein [Lysinibacillus fusiformis]MBD8524005.1 hypothetical protein [Lysinibacillus fusiformis]MCR8854797.1 hypothetical protein [Lysinibacillus fusiformis]MED4888981.1 hypothetical protein [Lysinibacillus fusiformis]ODV53251.1 hypothetical protein BG258_23395 [Lysinibacillus fusiformis]WKT77113.1 hypothetical protein QYY55_24550 [Lysinibacillus fusiformis]